jgi:hypothetical protein
MSKRLTEFLSRLAVDTHLTKAFDKDNVATMKAHGISEELIQLVIDKNYDEIQKVIGFDYGIAIESFIAVYQIDINHSKHAQEPSQSNSTVTRLAG